MTAAVYDRAVHPFNRPPWPPIPMGYPPPAYPVRPPWTPPPPVHPGYPPPAYPVRPAGSPSAPAPMSTVGEVRASIVRFGVTTASLTTGQLVLGEKDASAAVKRALTGAGLTELTTQALRQIQRLADLDAPLDPLFLASYGPRELQRFHDLLLQAWLTGTVHGQR